MIMLERSTHDITLIIMVYCFQTVLTCLVNKSIRQILIAFHPFPLGTKKLYLDNIALLTRPS